MKYWLDTEFIEDGETIDLISIGIVAEDGREYYAINLDCDLSKASKFVKENVIPKLPPKPVNLADPSVSPWKKKRLIQAEVADFLGAIAFAEISPKEDLWNRSLMKIQAHAPIWLNLALNHTPWLKPATNLTTTYTLAPAEEKPEIWAYYADYDWVVFCQLFGTMMDLPKGFPMYCRDIKQWCDMLGNPPLPSQGDGEHSALEDARWNRKAWECLNGLQEKQFANHP
jgi:hypothetical protein